MKSVDFMVSDSADGAEPRRAVGQDEQAFVEPTGVTFRKYVVKTTGRCLATSETIDMACGRVELEPAEDLLTITVRVEGAAAADGAALAQGVFNKIYLHLVGELGVPVVRLNDAKPVFLRESVQGCVRCEPVLATSTVSAVAMVVRAPLQRIGPAVTAESCSRAALIAFGRDEQPPSWAAFIAAVSTDNVIARFVLLYAALTLCCAEHLRAADRSRVIEQKDIDALIKQVDKSTATTPRPPREGKGKGKATVKETQPCETVFTRLRNEIMHAEDRQRKPDELHHDVCVHLPGFQRVVAKALRLDLGETPVSR